MNEQQKCPIYLELQQVVDLVGTACPTCQKKLYLALGELAERERHLLNVSNPFTKLQEELEKICQAEDFNIETVTHGNQRRKVHIRRLLALRARELGYSFPEIGSFLGKHHSTIVHLVKTNGLDRNKEGS